MHVSYIYISYMLHVASVHVILCVNITLNSNFYWS